MARVRVGATTTRCAWWSTAAPTPAPFDGRRVMPVPSGLVVALGADPALDAAVASASAQHAERRAAGAGGRRAADAPAESRRAGAERRRVKIYGVEFDAQPERDRVVVLAEQPVDYLVYEPDPETLILLASRTRRSRPRPRCGSRPRRSGAVSLVTAFAQPDVKTPEVRVVVKRAAGLKPACRARGRGADDGLRERRQRSPRSAGVRGRARAPPASGAGCAAPIARRGAGAPAAALPAEPASAAPPASIEILNEGGLMDGKEYVGRRISLDFKEVDIADVLRLIAEVSDLNVIAGDEVKGKVTIRLVDVPWDQALDVILLTKGLGFARVGNVLRIAPTDVLAQEEELRLQERRAKEKLEDLVVKLQPVNYAQRRGSVEHGEASCSPSAAPSTSTSAPTR